ncbi:hypothetical protein PZA11_001550 [Diplocarpon coronariae]
MAKIGLGNSKSFEKSLRNCYGKTTGKNVISADFILRVTQTSSAIQGSGIMRDKFVSLLDAGRGGGKDAELLEHYRHVISSRVVSVERSQAGEEIFETEARKYPAVRRFRPLKTHDY